MPETELPPVPSPTEVWAATTPAGGYSRATLAGWDIPWPAPKGWRKKLELLYFAQRQGAQVLTTGGPMEARIIPTEAMRRKMERLKTTREREDAKLKRRRPAHLI